MKLLPDKDDRLEYEFLPAALEITETPPSPFGRIVLWLIVGLLVIALAWSYFGKIDVIAVARGQIIPDGNVKIVQPSSSGVISSIKVSEGDHVKQGQVLAELDSTLASADVTSLQRSLNTAQLQRDIEKKLMSGEDITQTVADADIPADVKDDLLQLAKSKASASQVKQQLLSLSVSQAQRQLSTEQQNLKNIQAALKNAQAQQQQLQQALDQATDSNTKASTAAQLQTVNSQVASLQESQSSEQARITSAQSSLNEANANLSDNSIQNTLSFNSDIVSQDDKITQLQGELAKAQKNVDLQTLTSPSDGIVLSISSTTVGGVITTAQPFITIVPSGTPLLVDATLLNKDVGFVTQNQHTAIKVDAFSFQRYGYINGKVKSISPDAVNDQKLGSVYKMRVSISGNETNKDNKLSLSPGMSVTAEIKTGQRRIIDFFLDPLITKTNDSIKVR